MNTLTDDERQAEIERLEGLIKNFSSGQPIKHDGFRTKKAIIIEMTSKLLVLKRPRKDKIYKPVNVSFAQEWQGHWLDKLQN